ncbi:N-acetylglucosamine-6-phosphate deacetylase [Granulicella sp. WH15]|uniref:N-acetylglucosamine-6-phosphate deacetylase n=1 Tax=Granulicella sp. WH15 TaxID=2602070 RepID=UPI00136796BA|nr:N-acetylglucosamine-6-phosphate deacetylase [Granulicella sp. WH15]QHN03868.1 N-acetylglucosamine-6-phosphate deacetylase [Granulicella sp. WH15]
MPPLTARTLITSLGTIEYPSITIDAAGRIEDISTDPAIRSEAILTSTFLDIHIHGAAGEDLMVATPKGLSRIQRFLASRGTSHYLPTTVTASIDATLHALDALANLIESPIPANEATPLGIHLEGPFLSHAKRGVHPTDLLQPPSIELFDRFQQAARGHIRLLTIAPETPGALDLIAHATHSGVKVTLGHTNATAAETLAAIAAGATSSTHLFNAMRPLDHREPGVVGTILDRPDIYADLICDGIHVHPALVRLWLAQKQDKAILITDGISATGMPDGTYVLGPLSVTVHDHRCTLTAAPETLAGSVLTLDRAVANLQAFTGTDLATAVRCASANPAAMLGLTESLTTMQPGQPANFNLYTPTGQLQTTYIYGQPIL